MRPTGAVNQPFRRVVRRVSRRKLQGDSLEEPEDLCRGRPLLSRGSKYLRTPYQNGKCDRKLDLTPQGNRTHGQRLLFGR